MYYETIIAILAVIASLTLAGLGLDDGGLTRLVVTTYLGFLVGKNASRIRREDDNHDRTKDPDRLP